MKALDKNGKILKVGDKINNPSFRFERTILFIGDQKYLYSNRNGNEYIGDVRNLQFHTKVVPVGEVTLYQYLYSFDHSFGQKRVRMSPASDFSWEEHKRVYGYYKNQKLLKTLEIEMDYEIK